MKQYSYLIIGAGLAASSAIQGIREKDSNGSIGIISDEPYPCYERPMLSNALWLGTSEDAIWSQHPDRRLTYHLSRKIIEIRPDTQTVIDQHGTIYWYKQLLIATGSSPKQMTCPNKGVLYYNNLTDYYRLKDCVGEGEEFVIIGGGILGTELTYSLTNNDKEITLIYPQALLFEDFFPKDFAFYLTQYIQSHQVRLLPNTDVKEVKQSESYELVKLSSGEEIETNGVIACLGVQPNTELAKKLNFSCEHGIEVNRLLQTPYENIYAAGDVANPYSPSIKRRLHYCHEDAASHMGLQAGLNMGGAKQEYSHLAYFQSELFGLNYTAIGSIDAKLDIVQDWIVENKCGTLFYLENGVVVGGVLIGLTNGIEVLRALINAQEKIEKNKLTGLITV